MSNELAANASLANLAIEAYRKMQEELNEHNKKLAKVLGERPIGPTTVGEKAQQAAQMEYVAILDVSITNWTYGTLRESRQFEVPCWFTEVPGANNALLVYVPARLGLCMLIQCGAHQHLRRRITSLSDVGEMLTWTPAKCLAEKLARVEDRKTTELRLV